MKILIAGALTLAVFAALHIPVLKKRKGIILALYALGMILFFAVYNVRTLDKILKFYHPTDQTAYQVEFLENGEYPDAFLDEFLKGRTVYTPNDAYDVDDDAEPGEPSEYDNMENYWLYYYYHAVNVWNYLEFAGASVVKDDSLNDLVLSDEQKDYYEDLGQANDMMRYTFPLSKFNGEWGNSFYHYWFYGTFIGDSRVYICPEKIENAKELVVIWQDTDTHDTESYYIASKEYYDEVIAR